MGDIYYVMKSNQNLLVLDRFLGHDLDSLNLNIPQGFYLKTQLKIWDYQIKAEIKYAPPPDFLLYLDCDMSPLYWLGGLLTVQRSETNDQEGPKLYADIRTGKADVEIRGKCMANSD